MKYKKEQLKNLKVTIMGLGLNKGGLASALFFARHGASLTVTDLRDERVLQPSIGELHPFPVRFVLGEHREEDFSGADLVIKNPGVPSHSPFLGLARAHNIPIETDLSVFLSFSANPLLAVTGSKGKSTTASAIFYCLQQAIPGARLGGNITVSPLSFLDELTPGAPVVLELSSWQLADLKGRGLLKPRVAAITNILPDHMNAYPGMAEYIADKRLIFANQSPADFALLNYDDPVLKAEGAGLAAACRFFRGQPLPAGVMGAWLDGQAAYARDARGTDMLFEQPVHLPGEHNRLNLLAAGLALQLFGLDVQVLREYLPRFPGIEHRLELFLEKDNLKFYNDSAATIPHATIEALKSLEQPIFLIAGGTDKNIDFAPLAAVTGIPRQIFLLAGSATVKICKLLEEQGIPYNGPYADLRRAVTDAIRAARQGGGGSVLFSPACASFGMFLNEFDRGRQFKACVQELK